MGGTCRTFWWQSFWASQNGYKLAVGGKTTRDMFSCLAAEKIKLATMLLLWIIMGLLAFT